MKNIKILICFMPLLATQSTYGVVLTADVPDAGFCTRLCDQLGCDVSFTEGAPAQVVKDHPASPIECYCKKRGTSDSCPRSPANPFFQTY